MKFLPQPLDLAANDEIPDDEVKIKEILNR
jgi:hypothetical protein